MIKVDNRPRFWVRTWDGRYTYLNNPPKLFRVVEFWRRGYGEARVMLSIETGMPRRVSFARTPSDETRFHAYVNLFGCFVTLVVR